MFRGMEYVYEVYKEKSFSKAAESLSISQPSLSATIKKIEKRIGSPLFERTNPIRLTDCGREYIRSVERIMDIQAGFSDYLSDLHELQAGSLSVGASNFFSSFILPPIITKYIQRYPQVKVNLVEANTPQLEKLLFADSLDLILDNHALNDTVYNKQFLLSEHMVLAVPCHFKSNSATKEYQLTVEDILANRHIDPQTPAVPLQAFSHDPFIFLKAGNDTRLRAEKICEWHGIAPTVILELDQMATSYNVACYGMGIAFVNDTLIKMVHPDRGVVYYKLDGPHTKRDVFVYKKHSRYVTRAMEEFQKIATE